MDFQTSLCNVLTMAPLLTCILAAIGMATVFAGAWTVVRPFFSFLSSTPLTIMLTMGSGLFVFGMASYGYSQNEMTGACYSGGVTAAIVGAIHFVLQLGRHIIKWNYGELGDGL